MATPEIETTGELNQAPVQQDNDVIESPAPSLDQPVPAQGEKLSSNPWEMSWGDQPDYGPEPTGQQETAPAGKFPWEMEWGNRYEIQEPPAPSDGSVSGNESLMLQTLVSSGIQDRQTLGILMGQLAHESAGFKATVERASGAAYEGRKDLGNTEPGDGRRFKGRGFIQLTGRSNYERIGRMIGEDLVNNPDLAAEPEIAAKIAVAFLKSSGALDKARAGDIRGTTRVINGGYNGLQDRQRRTARYQSGALDSLMAAAGLGSNNNV